MISKGGTEKKIKNLAERFELGDLMKNTGRKMSLARRMLCEVADTPAEARCIVSG